MTAPEEPRTATPGEQVAFRLGITVAIDMALAAADAIEARPDAGKVRQQAAIAALQALAEGLTDVMLDVSARCIPAAFAATAPSPDLGADSAANV